MVDSTWVSGQWLTIYETVLQASDRQRLVTWLHHKLCFLYFLLGRNAQGVTWTWCISTSLRRPWEKKFFFFFGQPEYSPRQRNKQEWADTVAWRLLFQSQVVIIELRHWPATKFCFCFFWLVNLWYFVFRPRFQVTIMQYVYIFLILFSVTFLGSHGRVFF